MCIKNRINYFADPSVNPFVSVSNELDILHRIFGLWAQPSDSDSFGNSLFL
jgi:hypothetical protein